MSQQRHYHVPAEVQESLQRKDQEGFFFYRFIKLRWTTLKHPTAYAVCEHNTKFPDLIFHVNGGNPKKKKKGRKFSWGPFLTDGYLIVAGETCTVPCKHRVVWRLLFLLMLLLTHIQGGQVDTQEFSDSFPAVDVSVLIQNLRAHIKLNPETALRRVCRDTTHLCFHKFIPVVVWEGPGEKDKNVIY